MPESGGRGPALLSYGFRPFFLAAALWAALAMPVWLVVLSGHLVLPTALDPVSWHAHEFLFGYLWAVIAGFLLTAVPNWTGRPVLRGWRLAGLFGLWFAGRLAIALSAHLPPLPVALVDLALPVALTAFILVEIWRAGNWRNLIVVALLMALTAGNGLFHWESARGDVAASGPGFRLGLAAGVMLVAVIGGRVVPAFTRNWLKKRDVDDLPAVGSRFDALALIVLLLALAAWTILPDRPESGMALILAGLIHAVRLARWHGRRTGAEPLLWILHLGYAFVPLGALALGFALLRPEDLAPSLAQHLWMAGAIGLMTLAIMTRATLGHSGRPLAAGPGTVALYILLLAAIAARLAAGLLPDLAVPLHQLSGLCWIGAFGGFVLLYGPLLLRARKPD